MTERLPPTEGVDGRTAGIDRVDTVARVRLLVEAQRGAVDAALAASDAIARAVDAVVVALRAGGRIIVLGAGTSGRLAVLDASELPPTFGFARERYEGRIAGGDGALRRSIEGAEDDAAAGAASVVDAVRGDIVIGVSASGSAAFVRGALSAARANGALTIALVNAADTALGRDADLAIEVLTAAEPIAGSTRLRAGTAQKIVLNTISTAAMIALGKTYRNLMVDVVASNAKLRARAE
jgi:N-acetylmuramic acid 6-phosphate etherase